MQINIQELSKIYPNGKKALDNVNLEIGTGMFGLLGPNGAGKSSLMRILVTLMKPSMGSVSIDSFDLEKNRKEIRSMLGYLPQDFRFFSKLKTWEFLDYAASLSGIKNKSTRKDKVDEWLDKVGLFDVRERDANKLSGGMKRRLGIAQTLIGDPKIIVVDEPTTGLDPEERIRFRNILSDNGQVAFKGTPEALIEKARGHVWQVNTSGYEYDLIKDKYPVVSTIPTQEGWEVQLIGDGSKFTNAIELEPNLEHAYVYFMEMSSALI
ncbi:ATP-binding cassette domain-containing protein [Labilibaculum sp.]|uniref:ATP-binding cassette domain-containing protein n=1 Tax=Labilibaculum sp. TaxID=2060723 RepID=UPI002AA8822A|nr:ATP-binding cassette domain-containing protein [Labilibaculum sp.]